MLQSENIACLCGTVLSEPVPSHISYGRIFQRFQLAVRRLSGQTDVLNIIFDANQHSGTIVPGQRLSVDGQVRTHNQRTDAGTRLIITVAAVYMAETDEQDCNMVKLTGRLCKVPVYRITPAGREITDLLVAVQRKTGKTDFIPVITWGINAQKTEHAQVGTAIHLLGRLQSREYEKEINHQIEKRIAFELSAAKVELFRTQLD